MVYLHAELHAIGGLAFLLEIHYIAKDTEQAKDRVSFWLLVH